VDRLHGAEHAIIADRIETGTYACAAAITGGEVILHNGGWNTWSHGTHTPQA
jgi:UDP-N-acetylglucosamine 1-carboxyvinyltransferase